MDNKSLVVILLVGVFLGIPLGWNLHVGHLRDEAAKYEKQDGKWVNEGDKG
jgi:hypothetical protein